jgi:hypothetical protein
MPALDYKQRTYAETNHVLITRILHPSASPQASPLRKYTTFSATHSMFFVTFDQEILF